MQILLVLSAQNELLVMRIKQIIIYNNEETMKKQNSPNLSTTKLQRWLKRIQECVILACFRGFAKSYAECVCFYNPLAEYLKAKKIECFISQRLNGRNDSL